MKRDIIWHKRKTKHAIVRKRTERSPMPRLHALVGGCELSALNGKEEVVHLHETDNSRGWEKRGEYAPQP